MPRLQLPRITTLDSRLKPSGMTEKSRYYEIPRLRLMMTIWYRVPDEEFRLAYERLVFCKDHHSVSEIAAFGLQTRIVFDELIQHTIDESSGFVVRKDFCQFESLIHRHFRRHVRDPEQFVHRLS